MSFWWLKKWVKSKFSVIGSIRRAECRVGAAHRSPSRRRSSFRPMLEGLEERYLLSAPESVMPVQPQAASATSYSGSLSPSYIVDDSGKLFTVNDTTGQTKSIGATGTVMFDIALSPKGQLYGLGEDGYLYKINSTTAAATPVGPILDKSTDNPILSDANAMEFRSDGTLFVAAQNEVYQVNPQTAMAQQILTLPNNEQSAGDLVFNGSGDMLLTTTDGSLIETNSALTSATIVGNTGIGDVFGLVWSQGSLYGFSDSQNAIYKINPATAAATFQASLTPSDGVQPNGVDGATSMPLSPAAPPTYMVDTAGKLFTVNDTNGQTHLVGATGTVMFDIALSPNGQLYGLGENGDLYQINTTTAFTTLVGTILDQSTGQPILSDANAMEFRSDGTLFVAAQNEVYQVNPQTAMATQVLTLPNNEQSAGDLVFNGSGDMLLTTTNGSLIETNPALTSATIVGNTGLDDVFGLVISGGTLYGFGNSEDAIYQINPTTAAATLVAKFTPTDGVQPNGVNGATSMPPSLAASPTYIVDTTGSLFTVNDTTGQTHLVGQTGVAFSDIALSPSGQMYGMGPNANLYKINDATGATTLVGQLTDQSTGQVVPYDTFIMSFRSDGALFVATTSNVYQVNPQTAVAQLVFTNSEVLTSDEMVFDAKGDLFFTEEDGSLVEVNPSLTSIQTVGNTGVSDLYGLAWSQGVLYGFSMSGDDIYQINPATAAATLQANLTPTDGVQPSDVEGATSALSSPSATAPVITSDPTNQTVAVGHTATFTASASGTPTPTVQWQVSTDKAAHWSDISGATSTTLTLQNVQASQKGYEYRAVFTNSAGSTPTTAATLTVQSAATTSEVGVFNNGVWYLDSNGNGAWDGSPTDTLATFGFPGALPVSGNWGPNGSTDIGVYSNGTWYLNTDGTDVWKGNGNGNVEYNFGFAGATPVVGNWGPNGSTDIGVYYNGSWYLNTDGSGVWKGNGNGNVEYNFGFAGAIPVVGNWGPSGSTDIGIYYNGTWYLNTDGTGVWKGNGNGNVEYNFGFAGAIPVVGNWGSNGSTDIGIYYDGTWYLNTDGTGVWKGNGFGNVEYNFGFFGAVPVVGDWQLS
jgi:hypothetical protein